MLAPQQIRAVEAGVKANQQRIKEAFLFVEAFGAAQINIERESWMRS
jgi:hypothetical protein